MALGLSPLRFGAIDLPRVDHPLDHSEASLRIKISLRLESTQWIPQLGGITFWPVNEGGKAHSIHRF